MDVTATKGPGRLLEGLRRPTRRGIRKCPQCGTLNGTRGLSCKNRQCDMLFETAVAKRGIHAATRLVVAADEEDDVIGQNDEVFSVKLKSRSNPEQRGFVKVRRRRGGTGPGSAAEQVCVFCNLSDCVHVVACAPSSEESPPTTKESVPCSVKQSVLNSMSISGEWKHKIWLTARDYGPLAQRVSKSTMVVKCDADDKHKLGYLHTTFVLNEGVAGQQKFRCDCLESSSTAGDSTFGLQLSNSTAAHRCIHFYSCLAVFLSDPKLAKEFDAFIQDDQIVTGMLESIAAADAAGQKDSQVVAPLTVEVIQDNFVAQHQVEQQVVLQHAKPMTSQTLSCLVSMTEMMNLSYNYPQPGDKKHTLTLVIDHDDFDALKCRLSDSGDDGRRRLLLPNSTQAYVRSSAPPYGTFTRHVWRFVNLHHVKRVFDTEALQLQLASVGPDYLTCLDVKGETPFTVQWTPGILPLCQKGELVLSYHLSRSPGSSGEQQPTIPYSTPYLQHHDYGRANTLNC